MKTYLYLSLVPEALIASMLPPSEFGRYLSLSPERQTRGQAMFFQVAPFESDVFDLSGVAEKCVPHADGSPHRSSYVSIYRVFERVPMDALQNLFLTTRHGLTLELKRADQNIEGDTALHLYQELCPVGPRVASRLSPAEFGPFLTRPGKPIYLPRVAFAELKLGNLAQNPESGAADGLPYSDITHLRNCLVNLQRKSEKDTKIVQRVLQQDSFYPMIQKGIYVAEGDQVLFYEMPDEDELQKNHHSWWSSARTVSNY